MPFGANFTFSFAFIKEFIIVITLSSLLTKSEIRKIYFKIFVRNAKLYAAYNFPWHWNFGLWNAILVPIVAKHWFWQHKACLGHVPGFSSVQLWFSNDISGLQSVPKALQTSASWSRGFMRVISEYSFIPLGGTHCE